MSMTRRKRLSLAASALVVFAAATATSDAPVQFGDPLGGLTAAQLDRFNDGKEEFLAPEEVDEGLGPVFNGRSCAECHSVPIAGGGSDRLVTRFGTITNGVFDPLAQFGGSLIQDHAITRADGSVHNYSPESVPKAATIVAHRRTPPLFGLGLVDAVSDQTFFELAAQESRRGDGTAGRVAVITNVATGLQSVGKFGWKNQVPSLFVFSGDAYLNEMGITNPLFPNENCPNGDCKELKFNPRPDLNDIGDGVEAFNDFMTLLAAPPRAASTPESLAGEAIFGQIGCDACHTSTLHTGPSDVAALDHATFHPYSDFLLHDMGALGDGISQGAANGREMRTAPLWGLRMITTFLHDGRAATLTDAIAAHDGQARAARERFNALDAASQGKLLSFLKSL